MIKAVLFDLDDTLVKTYVAKWAQHKAVAKELFGSDLSEEKLREHWGKPFNQMIAELHDNAGTLERMLEAYESSADDFPKVLHDDTVQVIHWLLARGTQLGIVTATNRAFVLRDLERLGVRHDTFFCIQAADDTTVHKPDPRVFDPILEKLFKLGIHREETVYVGDALNDLYAARKAGIDFVAVTTGLHTAEEFKAAGADKIITKLGELPALIL